MFKKLKQKVAEDPTAGLAESSGKQTKSLVSSTNSPGRPVRTVALGTGDNEINTKSPTTPGTAVRLLDSDTSAVCNDNQSEETIPAPLKSSQGPVASHQDTTCNDAAPERADPAAATSSSLLALQEQLKYLQQRLTHAEANENAVTLERDINNRQLLELRQQVADQSQQLQEQQKTFNTLNEEFLGAQSALVKRDATIAQLHQECASVSSKLMTCEDQCRQAAEEAAQATSRCSDLEERSAALTEQLESLDAEHLKVQASLENEREEGQAQRLELLTAQEHNRQLQTQLSTQQERHAEEVDGLRERISAIGQQFAESDHPDAGQVAAIAAERDKVEVRLAEVRKQLANQQAASDEKIGNLEILNQERETELSRLHEKLDATETSLKSHAGMVKDLQDQLRSAKDQLESTIRQSEQRIFTLKTQLDGAESSLQQSKLEVKNLNQAADKNQQERIAKVSELNAQLSRAMEQLAESTTHSSGLVGQLENQLAQLQTAREIDRTTADSKMASLRRECSELRQYLSDSRKEVSKAAEERALLDADLTAAIDSIKSRNQYLVGFAIGVGHAVNDSLSVASFYSDEDGKLVHDVLHRWREEMVRVLDIVKGTFSGQSSKAQADEDEYRRLANALELEQYTSKRLQDELAAMKASLEEMRATSNNHDDAAVLPTSNHTNSPIHASAGLGESSKPALMAQASTAEVMSELASVNQTMSSMEAELLGKNQTIKQQQQLLADLRKQLQRQLGTARSSLPPAGSSVYRQESKSTPAKESTGNVNDLYLKNVILRYMCSSETEAQHLIKAISTLLGFTSSEEQLVRDFYSYKLSWFGSKPSQPAS